MMKILGLLLITFALLISVAFNYNCCTTIPIINLASIIGLILYVIGIVFVIKGE